MVDWSWVTSPETAIMMSVLTAVGIYVAVITFTRIAGLRSFSRMSTFDFAITVATGSLIATVILSKNPSLVLGVIALATLYVIQFVLSFLRSYFRVVQRLVDNEPLLLMAGPTILYSNLRTARMTIDDLRARLREANVIHPSQVRAVVMETTGEVSVLHAPADAPDLDLSLFIGVRGAESLRKDSDVTTVQTEAVVPGN